MFNHLGMDLLNNPWIPEGFSAPGFCENFLEQHKAEARRITRLALEAVEVAFYLCNRHLERYGAAKIYDVVNQILPTSYVTNTSYWPFYTNQFDQCICVCLRYGMRCPHRLNLAQHWINMEPLREDSQEEFRLHPMSATVSVAPIVYETVKAYDLDIDLLLRQIKIENDEFVFRNDHAARLTISVRYLVTPEHIKPPDTYIQFEPNPSLIQAYGSYFHNWLKSQKHLGSFGKDAQVPKPHTIVPCEIPRLNYVIDNPTQATCASYIEQLCNLILTPQNRRASSEAFTHTLLGRSLGHSSSRPIPTWLANIIRRDLACHVCEDPEDGPSTSSNQGRRLGQRSNERDRPRGVAFRNQRSPKAKRSAPRNQYTLILPSSSSAQPPRFVAGGERGETIRVRSREELEAIAEEMVGLSEEDYQVAFPGLPQARGRGRKNSSTQSGRCGAGRGAASASAPGVRVGWHIPQPMGERWRETARTSTANDVVVNDGCSLGRVSEAVEHNMAKKKKEVKFSFQVKPLTPLSDHSYESEDEDED